MRLDKAGKRVLGTIQSTIREIDAGRKQMTEQKRTLLKCESFIHRAVRPRGRRARRTVAAR